MQLVLIKEVIILQLYIAPLNLPALMPLGLVVNLIRCIKVQNFLRVDIFILDTNITTICHHQWHILMDTMVKILHN